MIVRRFENKDAEEVSKLIATTLRTSNIKDYSLEYIENDVKRLQPQNIIQRASLTHFYVACDDKNIIGTGAIGPYWSKKDESILLTIFVLPKYQGKGVWKFIIEALENDEFFKRSKRIEIPASITATNFYIKMGYNYKNGVASPDKEGLVRLEKFR